MSETKTAIKLATRFTGLVGMLLHGTEKIWHASHELHNVKFVVEAAATITGFVWAESEAMIAALWIIGLLWIAYLLIRKDGHHG